jgi:hypothetical protein
MSTISSLAATAGLAAALLLISAPRVDAGPSFVDSTGFAASGHDVVAYFDLPASATPARPVPGTRRFTAHWNGADYAFSSAANRDRFLAEPARFAPQYDGHCAWAAGQGYKAPASPTVWRIVGGRLFLNYSHEVRGRWEKGTADQIRKADGNWHTVGQGPAATGDAYDYTPSAAPLP